MEGTDFGTNIQWGIVRSSAGFRFSGHDGVRDNDACIICVDVVSGVCWGVFVTGAGKISGLRRIFLALVLHV